MNTLQPISTAPICSRQWHRDWALFWCAEARDYAVSYRLLLRHWPAQVCAPWRRMSIESMRRAAICLRDSVEAAP